jgi:peptidoglycan-associated lipoprotein
MSHPSISAGHRPVLNGVLNRGLPRSAMMLVVLTVAACDPAAGPAGTAAPTASPMPPQLATIDPNGNTTQSDLAAVQQALTKVGDRVFFETDRFDLTTADQEILRQQAALLAAHGAIKVIISGHGDERGTREYNLALGESRATATGNFLVALGIDRSRLTMISYGKERPACAEATEACWAQSRRAVTEVAAP